MIQMCKKDNIKIGLKQKAYDSMKPGRLLQEGVQRRDFVTR
jgi:hypothetical protein